MTLSVVDDLQQELPVVIVDLLCSQRAVIVNGEQIPAVHLGETHNY